MKNKKMKIKKIIEDVLEVTPVYRKYGCDEYFECPFCGGETEKNFPTMEDIEHCEDCAYVLAKELVQDKKQ